MAPSTDSHPDLADLEASRTGEAPAAVGEHLRSCADCRTVVDDLTRLASALAVADVPAVPSDVDGRIMWAARREAARARRSRTWAPRISRRGLAIAASVLLAVGVLRALTWPPAPAGDVDGNGIVDIRDAFLIARTLRAEGGAPPAFDVNGDHVVDERDVDVAARAAVSLARPS